MDFATLIGLIVGAAIITLAMSSGSELSIFVNAPGLMIVLGGAFCASLVKFPVGICFGSMMLALKKAFWAGADRSIDLKVQIEKLAGIARKKNLLALEDEVVTNPFLKKGLNMAIDGKDESYIRRVLHEDMEYSIERHELGERVFRSLGDAAPAFGMIGTLVGLVQMLSQMKDPSSIGPAMAIALLTTLYGALFANLVALPVADKMQMRVMQEHLNKSMIIEGVEAIRRGESPRVIDEMLESFLPSRQRSSKKDGK